jgi:hypothetical protein
MSRIHDDAGMIAAQLRHYRNYIERPFAPA